MAAREADIILLAPDPDREGEAISWHLSELLGNKSSIYRINFHEITEKAIQEALRGRSYVTPLVTRGMVGSFLRRPKGRKASHRLTPRQREVLQLLAEGHSMKEVAAILHVTPRTVAFHKYSMMEELGFKNSAALIRFAVKQRIVSI